MLNGTPAARATRHVSLQRMLMSPGWSHHSRTYSRQVLCVTLVIVGETTTECVQACGSRRGHGRLIHPPLWLGRPLQTDQHAHAAWAATTHDTQSFFEHTSSPSTWLLCVKRHAPPSWAHVHVWQLRGTRGGGAVGAHEQWPLPREGVRRDGLCHFGSACATYLMQAASFPAYMTQGWL
jgi:hypothetical protein